VERRKGRHSFFSTFWEKGAVRTALLLRKFERGGRGGEGKEVTVTADGVHTCGAIIQRRTKEKPGVAALDSGQRGKRTERF